MIEKYLKAQCVGGGWGDSSVQCLACTDETRVQVLAARLNDGVEAGVSNTRDGEA